MTSTAVTVSSPRPVAPAPAPTTDDTLDKLIRITDPVSSMASGPCRVALGIDRLRHARTRGDVESGVRNVATGVATAAYGVFQTLTGIATGAGLVGASGVALGAAGAALALGGTLAAGVTGCAAATLRGAHDIYQGHKDHNHLLEAAGAVKLVSGGLMAAGAATLNPALVLVGGLIYVGAGALASKDEIAGIYHQVMGKLHPPTSPQR